MKDGQIEQLGTPAELYAEPRTAFAADFMGFENIFRIEAGALVSEQGRLLLGFDVEDRFLAWRPGGVVIGEGDHTGRVIASSFAGQHRNYVLDCALGQIKADVPIETPEVPIGQEVAFDLPRATARPLGS
jgi:putative spermidine/putrescine transport system ATP-binding protein